MKHPFDDESPRHERAGHAAEHLGTWSRAEFESALPLYVGGELEADDRVRVELWLAEHPSDGELLAAASDAVALLREHARTSIERAESMDGPGLWPGIRAELLRSGYLEPASPASEVDLQPPFLVTGGRGAAILAGPGSDRAPVRWYERRAVAAAAAVVLCLGVASLFRSGAEALNAPEGSIPVHRVADTANGGGTGNSPAVVPLVGPSEVGASVRLAGGNAGRGVPFYVAPPGAPQMIDEAIDARIYQLVEPFPAGDGPQLTSGQ